MRHKDTQSGNAATEPRASVWSARSLLPLWDRAGRSIAAASRAHSKRFARFAARWVTQPSAKPRVFTWGLAAATGRQLQALGAGEELSHACEQPAGSAAVEHAMIETEREVGFHDGHECAFGCVPAWHASSGAHSQHQRLLR